MSISYTQEATPAPTPTKEELTSEQLANIVQSVHPEKRYGFLPGLEEEAVRASVYGLDVETYRAIKNEFAGNARRAAEELLTDPVFADQVDRLPFEANTTVVGIGESVTDDLQSWLEIIRHLLDLRRSQDGIRVINQGIEGTTTTEALNRIVQVVVQQPEWILCLLGAADAVKHGQQPTKTLVSLHETALNFAELRRIAEAQSDASWVWITPPTVNEEIASQFPPFQQIQFTLRNKDLIAIGDILRGQSTSSGDVQPVRPDDYVIDIQSVLGLPAPPELVQPDGIHPSLAGQKAIAKAVVERLT